MREKGWEGQWLTSMLERMFVELDPHSRIFVPTAPGTVARAALAGGFVLAEFGAGPLRVPPGWIPKERVRSVLCARFEELPLRVPQNFLHIDAAYTEPEFRRGGLMRDLLLAAEQGARKSGARALSLGVLDCAPEARAFWEHCGFVARSVRLERLTE